MNAVPPPLAALLDEVEQALRSKIYYSALTVSLTLPDICASLEADPAVGYWSKQHKYAEWFDRNAKHMFQQLDGMDCYFMRGGVVHRGHLRHAKSRFDRIVFMIPGSPFQAHDMILEIQDGVTFGGKTRAEITGAYPGRPATGKVLFLDVEKFCRSVSEAVRLWIAGKSSDANVQANLRDLVHYRSGGIPHFLVGFPVIA